MRGKICFGCGYGVTAPWESRCRSCACRELAQVFQDAWVLGQKHIFDVLPSITLDPDHTDGVRGILLLPFKGERDHQFIQILATTWNTWKRKQQLMRQDSNA